MLGEPPVPGRLHPVALLGSAVGGIEDKVYADAKLPGVIYTATGVGLGLGASKLVRSPMLACYLSTSGRALHTAANAVGEALLADDLPGARRLLPQLVGRDPSHLGAGEIARAVVESIAENTTDAIVAPALWTAAAGAPGAFAHRVADTLDSMVGYRNERYRQFGSASARLDDVLAWLPARATATLVALVRPHHAPAVVRTVRRDAPSHPSPNAGVAEAAFAAALGLKLGDGTNRYGDQTEQRPPLGQGRPPAVGDISRTLALSRDVTWALAVLLAAFAHVSARRQRTRPR